MTTQTKVKRARALEEGKNANGTSGTDTTIKIFRDGGIAKERLNMAAGILIMQRRQDKLMKIGFRGASRK